MLGKLRTPLLISAVVLPAIMGGAPLLGQEPSTGWPCGFLNFTKKELSGPLSECRAFMPFIPPEMVLSQPMQRLLRGEALPMQFGQGRFAQRFPLHLNDLYPPKLGNDRSSNASPVKQAVLGGTVRGGMVDDGTDDIGQPTVRVGTVTWNAVPPLLSATSSITGVHGNLTIEGYKVAMSLAMSPVGTDGLMIEIKIRGEGEVELGVPRIRQTGDRSGEPMDMVGRRRSEDEFTFIPAADPQSLRNIKGALLKGQWIDVPVRRKGETAYTLTMELARPGNALMKRAFEDWTLSDNPR